MLWSSYHQKRPSSYKTVLIVHSLSTTAPGEKGTFLALGTNCAPLCLMSSFNYCYKGSGRPSEINSWFMSHSWKKNYCYSANLQIRSNNRVTDKKGNLQDLWKNANKLRKLSSLGCRKKLAQISPLLIGLEPWYAAVKFWWGFACLVLLAFSGTIV